MSDEEVRVDVGGRALRLRRLDKVLYPATGTTKAEVLDYYARVAGVLLPHLARRPVTRKRWPDGVAGPSFFEKNLPRGTPDWVASVTLPTPGSSTGRDDATFPLVLEVATLVWLANLAALELHVPQWQVGPRGAVQAADRLVIDLDPGPPAGLAECCWTGARTTQPRRRSRRTRCGAVSTRTSRRRAPGLRSCPASCTSWGSARCWPGWTPRATSRPPCSAQGGRCRDEASRLQAGVSGRRCTRP